MKIGFDYRPALKKNSRGRGIGRCVADLLKALLHLDRQNDYVVYTLRGAAELELPARNAQEYPLVHLKTPSRLNWIVERFQFARSGKRDSLDLLHVNDITSLPASAGCQLWVTVHDLIPFIFWENLSGVPKDFLYALESSRKRIAGADHIVTSSENSKNDICRLLGNPADRVHVVPLGFSKTIPTLSRGEAAKILRERFDVGPPFLFYVGGSDYRKNLPFLIRAFSKVKEGGYQGRLILAGETFEWDIPEVLELRERIKEQGLGSDVLFPGYVRDGDLGAFYAAADFFVFPSLYEGFGLPVLEAMRCGAPLLVTNTSSVPEVAEDSAFYFSPEDLESFQSSFWGALESSSEVEEKKRRALELAGRYTWERTAGLLLDLYGAHS